MKNKILITGATGFLGKNILKIFDEKDIPYIGISKNGGGNIQALDLTDLERTKSFFKNLSVKTIVHAASLVDLSRDYQTAIKCVDNNLLATMNLLEACQDKTQIRFIYISSEEVYGSNPPPYKENQAPLPPSPYSISKVAAENYLRYFAKKYSLESIVLRMSTMYGPNMPSNKFFHKVIKAALSNNPIALNSGQNKRDYLYVEDAVKAILKSADVELPEKFSIFNIGHEASSTLTEFIKIIINQTISESKIKYGAIPERTTEAKNWFVNNSKAKRILNWEPETSLTTGISKTINFYQKNL